MEDFCGLLGLENNESAKNLKCENKLHERGEKTLLYIHLIDIYW